MKEEIRTEQGLPRGVPEWPGGRRLMSASLLMSAAGILLAAVGYGLYLRTPGALARTERPPIAALGRAGGPAASSVAPQQPPEGFFIIVRPHGFEPKEVTGDAGRFLFAVDNRSGLQEVQLRLDREAGERLNDVRVARDRLDWRAFIDLTPGHYVLTEANHPDWRCDITIVAR